MSAKELISPYLNRFVDLLYKKSTAKVELSCKDGQMSISMFHELGIVEEATPEAQPRMPSYNEVVRNNISNSQARRLEKRAIIRAEEARAQTKVQQEIAENAKHELDKYMKEAEEACERAEQAKTLAEKSKFEADKSRKESEKFVKDSEEARKQSEEANKMASESKFEAEKAKETLDFVADKAHQDIIIARKEAEDAKILAYREAEQAKQDNLKAKVEEHTTKGEVISQAVSKSCSLKMTPWTLENEVKCEFCDEEFDNKKLLKEHIQHCPICKIDFNEFPYCLTNHIQMNQGKYCCESCGECFIDLSKKKDHKKTCFKCDNCTKYFERLTQLRKHSRKCVPYEEENTDESESSD